MRGSIYPTATAPSIRMDPGFKSEIICKRKKIKFPNTSKKKGRGISNV